MKLTGEKKIKMKEKKSREEIKEEKKRKLFLQNVQKKDKLVWKFQAQINIETKKKRRRNVL